MNALSVRPSIDLSVYEVSCAVHCFLLKKRMLYWLHITLFSGNVLCECPSPSVRFRIYWRKNYLFCGTLNYYVYNSLFFMYFLYWSWFPSIILPNHFTNKNSSTERNWVKEVKVVKVNFCCFFFFILHFNSIQSFAWSQLAIQ